MGNQATPIQSSQASTESQQTKRLIMESERLSRKLNLDSFGSSVLKRIFVQRRQKHLIKIVESIRERDQLDHFLEDVHTANLEILDSFYEHVVKAGTNTNRERDYIASNNSLATGFDREIGICGSSTIMRDKQWQNISQKYVDLVDLSKGTQHISSYQSYKQKGLEAIRKQQVCFIILAGGKNMRYDIKVNKQCDSLAELPSKSSLIEIFLKRFEALGKLIDKKIHIYIMVDNEEHKKKIRKIKSSKLPNPEFIEVNFLSQISYGALDTEGKVVLTNQNQVFFHPNGSGDLWANFQGLNFIQNSFNKFKYVQIFGVSNLLEHCFDCFMIGKLKQQNYPWLTMSIQNKLATKNSKQNPLIFIASNTIHIRDPQEIGQGMDPHNLSYFPQTCPHIFLNNTVFSIEYIQACLNSPHYLEHRKYHCKCKEIDYRQPLSAYSSIYVFQRQLTDIFSMTALVCQPKENPSSMQCGNFNTSRKLENWQGKVLKGRGAVVLMNCEEYYARFITKYDAVPSIIAMSQMFKAWLGIRQQGQFQEKGKASKIFKQRQPKAKKMVSEYQKLEYYEQKIQKMCEIDPFVSIQGQNLEQIVEELKQLNGNIEYPLYICPQEMDPHSSDNTAETSNRVNEATFSNLRQFTY